LEYQRTNFSANINKYHMLSGKKLVNDTGEKAFSGYDVKFSGQAPRSTQASALRFILWLSLKALLAIA
jgi:hypothetical protein